MLVPAYFKRIILLNWLLYDSNQKKIKNCIYHRATTTKPLHECNVPCKFTRKFSQLEKGLFLFNNNKCRLSSDQFIKGSVPIVYK